MSGGVNPDEFPRPMLLLVMFGTGVVIGVWVTIFACVVGQ